LTDELAFHWNSLHTERKELKNDPTSRSCDLTTVRISSDFEVCTVFSTYEKIYTEKYKRAEMRARMTKQERKKNESELKNK
jgi:ribosome-binding factor A